MPRYVLFPCALAWSSHIHGGGTLVVSPLLSSPSPPPLPPTAGNRAVNVLLTGSEGINTLALVIPLARGAYDSHRWPPELRWNLDSQEQQSARRHGQEREGTCWGNGTGAAGTGTTRWKPGPKSLLGTWPRSSQLIPGQITGSDVKE
ncbi:hypothetical protein DPEC_G00036930 [Dallia pectoralis]|uniref:Uncharacterized protein n=1 Tax=Dallia pectoralis TaxID=75939 RepID=A0ACC2HE41_DALPE|nr:hypothetical protein DPEC_G00036930 [Dallia pectoralis]